jgi:hypothetical protein
MGTKAGDLIDQILGIALGQFNDKETWTFVGHRFPDDDVWVCMWLAHTFTNMKEFQMVFVNAGETIPEEKNGPFVLHFDTGMGRDDHHGKADRKPSSAQMLAERLGIINKPGLKPILDMVAAVDNINPLPPTSLHYAIEGFPRHERYRNGNGVNWEMVKDAVFDLLDIIYGQERQRIASRETLKEHGVETSLPNGIKIIQLLWHPECREAAFENGAHVVVWTAKRGRDHFYTGIQVNRKYPLYLDNAAAALRTLERQARHEKPNGDNFKWCGKMMSWYLHDTKKLLLNGSRSWKPTEEEYTKLLPSQIIFAVQRAMDSIPAEVVKSW